MRYRISKHRKQGSHRPQTPPRCCYRGRNLRYFSIYILALKMVSPGNQHFANYIGTLSFPIRRSCHGHRRNFGKVWTCGFIDIARGHTGRQTDRPTDTLITILRSPAAGVVIKQTAVGTARVAVNTRRINDCH